MRVHLTRRRQSEDAQWDITDSPKSQVDVDLREGDTCTLTVEARAGELGADAANIRLVVSGARLPPDMFRAGPDSVAISWSWSIDFYAGEVSLELVAASRMLWHGLLDVRPHEGKLGKEAYDELIADLQDRVENVVFGATAAQRGVGRAEATQPPIARFALLRAHMGELERVFARIVESPNRRLVAERERRPLDQARRLDARSVRSIARSPSALAALGHLTVDVELEERPRVDHPRREHTFNTAVNRHAAALIRQLSNVCRDSRMAFQRTADLSDGDAPAQARASGLVQEAMLLQRRVAGLGRAEFLTDVPPVSGDTAALIAVAKDPKYARLDWLARRALTPRLALASSALHEKLWLRRTYELYEYWCFFRTADALAEHWPGVVWQLHVETSQDGLLLGIRDGCYLDGRASDVEFRLTFQKTFRAYRPDLDEADIPYSVSGERRPDIVLTIREGQRQLMVLLDAKYRCSRSSIHAALADMHVYRDSLRVSGSGGKPLAAFILTPSHDDGCNAYYTEQYRHRHGLGGFDLAPRRSDQAHHLAQRLSALIRSAGVRCPA